MGTGYVGTQATAHQRAPRNGGVPLTALGDSSSATRNALRTLTPRQRDVLNLMMQGKSNKGICRILSIAEPTVKNHVMAILQALDVTNRTEAVIKVVRASVPSMSSSRNMPCTYLGYIPIPTAPLTFR